MHVNDNDKEHALNFLKIVLEKMDVKTFRIKKEKHDVLIREHENIECKHVVCVACKERCFEIWEELAELKQELHLSLVKILDELFDIETVD